MINHGVAKICLYLYKKVCPIFDLSPCYIFTATCTAINRWIIKQQATITTSNNKQHKIRPQSYNDKSSSNCVCSGVDWTIEFE